MTDENNQNDDVSFEPIPENLKDKVGDTEDEFVPEDGEGNTGTSKDIAKDLREKLKKAIAEKQEYLDGWQRSKAEFVNARKRDEETRKEVVKFANEGLIAELLPVLESFEMARANKETWESVDKNWRMGVEYIQSQLLKTLQDNGLEEVDPKGLKFDPMRDEAVTYDPVDDEKQNHVVTEVIQKGYNLNGKSIKAPRVKVGEYKKE